MAFVEWGWYQVAYTRARLPRVLEALGRGSRAQSTVEYALVGALVVIAAATAMTALGGEVTSVFNKITTTLSGAAPSH